MLLRNKPVKWWLNDNKYIKKYDFHIFTVIDSCHYAKCYHTERPPALAVKQADLKNKTEDTKAYIKIQDGKTKRPKRNKRNHRNNQNKTTATTKTNEKERVED